MTDTTAPVCRPTRRDCRLPPPHLARRRPALAPGGDGAAHLRPVRADPPRLPGREYVAEATACGITSAVYVQANWPLDRCVDEVRWLRDVHAETGWPTAVVGSADLFDEGAADVMRRQAALTPLVRGTRLQLHWHERPEFRFASAPDRMKDPVFRRNIAALADLGWLFELQVFADQMADAAALVGGLPRCHVRAGPRRNAGRPESRAGREWTRGMRLLAERPNVVVKLTGQGTFVHRVDRTLIETVTATCLELFGSRRCMWGSNFPIEKTLDRPAHPGLHLAGGCSPADRPRRPGRVRRDRPPGLPPLRTLGLHAHDRDR